MTAGTQFAVVATKASTGTEVVFRVCDDRDDAVQVAQALANLGLPARVLRAPAGTIWPGMTWPPIQANRGE